MKKDWKVGDRVKVYGAIETGEFYAYRGAAGVVRDVAKTCLWVSFDGDDERLPHCCNSAQVHKKQCRRLKKRASK